MVLFGRGCEFVAVSERGKRERFSFVLLGRKGGTAHRAFGCLSIESERIYERCNYHKNKSANPPEIIPETFRRCKFLQMIVKRRRSTRNPAREMRERALVIFYRSFIGPKMCGEIRHVSDIFLTCFFGKLTDIFLLFFFFFMGGENVRSFKDAQTQSPNEKRDRNT